MADLTRPARSIDGSCCSCGGALVAGLALRAGRARGAEGALFVSCRVDAEAGHHVTGIDASGRVRFDLPLPERGHGIAFRPGADEGLVFARRPGTFAVAFDPVAGIALRRIDAAAGRHFYGHGAFSPDGRYLFTSENDYEAGRGVLGVRDATDGYRQIGELASFGVGPHEVVLMPDGATLAIANGGIRTHPERDRAKLNLDSMAPSLAYLDLADGKLRGDYRLAEAHHQLSIRHLAVLGSGGVAIAMQYEGDMRDRVPLVGIHDGDRIRLLEAPAGVQAQMRQYGGSVAVDRGRQPDRGLGAARQPDHLLGCRRGRLSDLDHAGGWLRRRADRAAGRVPDHERPWPGDALRAAKRPAHDAGAADLSDSGWDNHLRMAVPQA